MSARWVRTCQECLNEQEDIKPIKEPTEAYNNRKCNVCKSSSLDYGTEKE